MPIPKNVAQDIPFALINSTDGSALTGASPTVYRSLDGNAQSLAAGSVSELGNGQYVFEGLAADFNANYTVGLLFTANSAVPVHVVLQMAFFRKDIAYDIPFLLIDANASQGLTGASPVGKRCLDGGAQAAVTGSFTELGNGQYVFEASVADFGASNVAGFLITATGAVPVHLIIDLLESYTATNVLEDSPAAIIAAYLTGVGIMTVPSGAGDWPLYIGFLPDTPDNVASAYNTTPIKDGRAMGDGSVKQHYGVEILLRAGDEETGWSKCNAIAGQLDTLRNFDIAGSNGTYRLHNVSRAGGINSLGLESGTVRRNMFSVNFLVSITSL